MQQCFRLSSASVVSARALSLTHEVVRAMLWHKVQFPAVAALIVGVACVGAGVYVRGSQEQTAKGGQPAAQQPTNAAAATSQPKDSKDLTEQPWITTPEGKLRALALVTRRAKAIYEIAKLNVELAKIDLHEYVAVKFPKELVAVESEIKLARAKLHGLENNPEYLPERKSAFNIPVYPEVSKESKELTIKKAQFALEQAESKRKVLVDYTKPKTFKELESEVEKARSDEIAKNVEWRLAAAEEFKLERELHPKTK